MQTEQILRQELGREERLLWSSMPLQGLRLRTSDAVAIPFSLLWGGFAFFWEYSAVTSHAPFFFMLWGVPFVLMGLYITVGRFFVDGYLRTRTYYGVTDRRVIIISGFSGKEVKSLNLSGLNDISLKEQPDRSGSITFGASNPIYAMRRGTAWPGVNKQLAPAFDPIAEARKVYDVVREAQHAQTVRVVAGSGG
ncbi:PH domain-containing protein [Dyella choica]|uniref:PH domain-containing protein n=1 Tax=Dyella choica TaxID=1927959 RepID=UPI0013154717|nr:PH domain-containing protein [Dyella choica]